MTAYTIQKLENEALNNQFISQDEQSKKKQIHLASLATTLKTTIYQLTPKATGNSHESLQKAMAEMQAILSELMGHFTEVQEQLQNGQLQIGQTMATASEAENLQKLNETTKQIDKNERHEKEYGNCRPGHQSDHCNHHCRLILHQRNQRRPRHCLARAGRCICTDQPGEFLPLVPALWFEYLPQAGKGSCLRQIFP